MLIDGLIDRMQAMLGPLQAADDPRQHFHATYLRTTVATREQLRHDERDGHDERGGRDERGGFEDAGWVERWDVAFAGFYLDALQAAMAGRPPSRPWQIAFSAPAELPALLHVLLGMNAHINFDLPQAIVAVITDAEFRDAALLARREADHAAIDRVLAARVAAEQAELVAISGPGSLLDRLLGPLSRLGTQRFLRESREKVWANAVTLNQARRQGPESYAAAVAELEELSAAKVTTLTAPGRVLLRLAATGFGVRLPAGRDDTIGYAPP